MMTLFRHPDPLDRLVPSDAIASGDARELIRAGMGYERAGSFDRALARYREARTVTRLPADIAEALWRESRVLCSRCEWDDALEAARKSAEIAQNAGRTDLLSEARNAEALVHQSRGEHDRAKAIYERMLETTDDSRIQGIALQNLGSIAAMRGDLDTAERRFAESAHRFREAGYRRGEAFAMNNQGRALLDRGDSGRAKSFLDQAVAVAKDVGDLDLAALAMLNCADAFAAQERFTRAEDLASTALGFFTITGNGWRRVECLRALGDLYRKKGSDTLARRCYGTGLELATDIEAKVEIGQLRERLEGLPGGGEP